MNVNFANLPGWEVILQDSDFSGFSDQIISEFYGIFQVCQILSDLADYSPRSVPWVMT